MTPNCFEKTLFFAPSVCRRACANYFSLDATVKFPAFKRDVNVVFLKIQFGVSRLPMTQITLQVIMFYFFLLFF